MSDAFQGPGWWMASDGKWYPPHLHADASYRARWVNVATTAPAPDTSDEVLAPDPAAPSTPPATSITAPATEASWVPETRATRPVADVPPTPFMPSDKVAERAAALADTNRADTVAPVAAPAPQPAPAPVSPVPPPTPVTPAVTPVPDAATNAMPEPVVAPHEAPTPLAERAGSDGFVGFGGPSSTPVSEILNRLDAHVASNGSNGAGPDSRTEPPLELDPEPEPDSEQPEVRVGADELPTPDAIDVEPAEGAAIENPQDTELSAGRARLEVGMPADRGEERFGLLTPNPPTEQRFKLQEQPRLSESTDLVPVSIPEIAVYRDGPSLHDRLVATVLFLSGVALIVGTFLVWTTGPGTEETGWEMTDGIATIIAGVLGSAAAGPIFVGFRHVVPKTIAILSGLVALVVPGLHGLEALSDSALAETGVGAGFWTVLAGAIAMLLAGVADQSRFGD